MKYFRKIVGDKVYLSPMNVDDYSQYVEWLNNYDIAKCINHYANMVSIVGEKEWLEKASSEKYNFAIIKKEDDTLMGNISLMHINFVDRTAELGIFIGNTENLSHGYGSEAIMLLLDYAFNQVNLNNIMLKVYDFNKRAIKAYEKCGFKIFGVWEESHYVDGEYCGEVYMNVLKKDFIKNKKIKEVIQCV